MHTVKLIVLQSVYYVESADPEKNQNAKQNRQGRELFCDCDVRAYRSKRQACTEE